MLTCAGWPNGKKLAANCVHVWARPKSTQVHANRGKSMQVGGQTKRKLNASPKLASTCESVWPGLYISWHKETGKKTLLNRCPLAGQQGNFHVSFPVVILIFLDKNQTGKENLFSRYPLAEQQGNFHVSFYQSKLFRHFSEKWKAFKGPELTFHTLPNALNLTESRKPQNLESLTVWTLEWNLSMNIFQWNLMVVLTLLIFKTLPAIGPNDLFA